MISNSISLKNNLAARWDAIAPAWRWAVGVFLAMRAFYTIWSLIVLLFVPSILQNLDLFGTPIVATFDLNTGGRRVFSRVVNGQTLTFQIINAQQVTDMQTGSVWLLNTGRAIRGAYAGTSLSRAAYTEEDVFPYLGVSAAGGWLGIWQRFDTNWYLRIAEQGYAGDDGSAVYFPLYPLLIHGVGLVTGNDMLAAVFISNVAFIMALYLLYRLTDDLFGGDIAKRALIYLAVFPTAFFFLAGYTESLFLALVLGSLYFAKRQMWIGAGACGALAALTRLQGVLLLVPLGYMAWQQNPASRWRALFPLVLLLLATTGFLWFNRLSLLSSYEGELHARFVLPWENVWNSVTLLARGGASLVDALNLGITIFFGVMCIAVWRTLPREFALYTFVMFLAPLFRMTTLQPLVSMARYVLVLFPVWMLWALWGKNAWVNRVILYPSVLLSLYLSAQFWLWGWVA